MSLSSFFRLPFKIIVYLSLVFYLPIFPFSLSSCLQLSYHILLILSLSSSLSLSLPLSLSLFLFLSLLLLSFSFFLSQSLSFSLSVSFLLSLSLSVSFFLSFFLSLCLFLSLSLSLLFDFEGSIQKMMIVVVSSSGRDVILDQKFQKSFFQIPD